MIIRISCRVVNNEEKVQNMIEDIEFVKSVEPLFNMFKTKNLSETNKRIVFRLKDSDKLKTSIEYLQKRKKNTTNFIKFLVVTNFEKTVEKSVVEKIADLDTTEKIS